MLATNVAIRTTPRRRPGEGAQAIASHDTPQQGSSEAIPGAVTGKQRAWFTRLCPPLPSVNPATVFVPLVGVCSPRPISRFREDTKLLSVATARGREGRSGGATCRGVHGLSAGAGAGG